ncbi:hypothetical protein B6V74_14260 [Thioclava sp. F42-5]|uniref:hypothetical protein n=1 Tax=Thioclava sp. F42-5 TaxID=1973005 RepID=UPI000B5413D1|nr:hypothetical protein [Thioclava sp. F42-5]OWY08308.1 hypothetical protein B6V74_14260 [Thioclava sp. F42-5]
MRTIRKISMIGATFLLAAATGHVMQSVGPRPQLGASLVASSVGSETWEKRAAPPREEPKVRLISKTVLRNPPVYHFAADPGVGIVPATVRTSGDQFNAPLPQPMPLKTGATDCDNPVLSVSPVGDGLTKLELNAPCHPDTNLAIRDESLSIAGQTDASGVFEAVLPLLAPTTSLQVTADGAMIAQLEAGASGLDKINRAIWVTKAESPLHLNAYENGAQFDDAGHLDATKPRSPDTSLGGYMQSFTAADGKRIEIYTAPKTLTDLRLQLEASFSPEDCGKSVGGRLMRMHGTGTAAMPITLDLPACPSDGGTVVLPLDGFESQGLTAQK